jgi:hypothetical protein
MLCIRIAQELGVASEKFSGFGVQRACNRRAHAASPLQQIDFMPQRSVEAAALCDAGRPATVSVRRRRWRYKIIIRFDRDRLDQAALYLISAAYCFVAAALWCQFGWREAIRVLHGDTWVSGALGLMVPLTIGLIAATVGLVFLFSADMERRRARVILTARNLIITSWAGRKFSAGRDEIVTVGAVAEASKEEDGTPLSQLRIERHDRAPLCGLPRRTMEELIWVERYLRSELGLPGQTDDAVRRVVPPAANASDAADGDPRIALGSLNFTRRQFEDGRIFLNLRPISRRNDNRLCSLCMSFRPVRWLWYGLVAWFCAAVVELLWWTLRAAIRQPDLALTVLSTAAVLLFLCRRRIFEALSECFAGKSDRSEPIVDAVARFQTAGDRLHMTLTHARRTVECRSWCATELFSISAERVYFDRSLPAHLVVRLHDGTAFRWLAEYRYTQDELALVAAELSGALHLPDRRARAEEWLRTAELADQRIGAAQLTLEVDVLRISLPWLGSRASTQETAETDNDALATIELTPDVLTITKTVGGQPLLKAWAADAVQRVTETDAALGLVIGSGREAVLLEGCGSEVVSRIAHSLRLGLGIEPDRREVADWFVAARCA